MTGEGEIIVWITSTSTETLPELARDRVQTPNHTDGAGNITQTARGEGELVQAGDWERLGIIFAPRYCWAANVQI